MAKRTRTIRTIDLETFKDVAEKLTEGRPYKITDAEIKDDLCNYSYEIIRGIGVGDSHSVKGSALVDQDLSKALAQFNVHLAVIDDAFKHSGIEVEDIDEEHGHDLAFLYTTTALKIRGTEDSPSIILIGHKYLSSGGRMKIESPKISLDKGSSYKWYNELKAAADAAREEVALYKEGKCTPVEVEENLDSHPKLEFGDGDAKDNIEKEFEGAEI
jgi:hypothetical protein